MRRLDLHVAVEVPLLRADAQVTVPIATASSRQEVEPHVHATFPGALARADGHIAWAGIAPAGVASTVTVVHRVVLHEPPLPDGSALLRAAWEAGSVEGFAAAARDAGFEVVGESGVRVPEGRVGGSLGPIATWVVATDGRTAIRADVDACGRCVADRVAIARAAGPDAWPRIVVAGLAVDPTVRITFREPPC